MRNTQNDMVTLWNLLMLYGALSSVCLGLLTMSMAIKILHNNNYSNNPEKNALSTLEKNRKLATALVGGLMIFNGCTTLKAGESTGYMNVAINAVAAVVGLPVLRDYI